MKLTYFVSVCERAMAAFRHKITSKNNVSQKKKKKKKAEVRKMLEKIKEADCAEREESTRKH